MYLTLVSQACSEQPRLHFILPRPLPEKPQYILDNMYKCNHHTKIIPTLPCSVAWKVYHLALDTGSTMSEINCDKMTHSLVKTGTKQTHVVLEKQLQSWRQVTDQSTLDWL